jgi:type IV pilus secretin PilQ/predicted competence protein
MIASRSAKQATARWLVSKGLQATSVVGASALIFGGCAPAGDPVKRTSPDATVAIATEAIAPEKVDTSVQGMDVASVVASPVEMAQSPKEAQAIVEKPILTALDLKEASPDGSEVRAMLSESTRYELLRTAPSEFVLKLPGTDVGEQIAATLIAKEGSGSIKSVRSISDDKGVELRIFVNPQANLVALRDGSNLTVRDIGLVADESALAQAKEEAGTASKTEAAAKSNPKEEEGVAADVTAATGEGDNVDESIAKFLDEGPQYSGRLISLDLQDTDIDNALRIIAEVSNLNIIASEEVSGKVTLRLNDVPWDQALDVILKTNGLDKVQEGSVVRIAPFEKLRLEREGLRQAQQAAEELEPLSVKYFRVSYAKASELKPLLDKVISERGQVVFDERSNQVIIRDIQRGLRNSAQMIKKLDLRTPQVLLETQIVEARRNFLRNLGSQTGFRYVQAPEIGNGTGYVFPNSVDIGGVVSNGIASGANPISFLFGSADGSRTLTEVLTAEEQEGRVKVVSKPAVATLNNKAATIKSTVAIRIRIPQGGNVVSTGQTGNLNGGAQSATEKVETGIILEVTPQASPDYYVFLDIKAKSSTLGPPYVDGIPSEIERATNSSVLVSSGQTFAMGGVYKLSESGSNNGLPWFKDIPVLGTFFRTTGIDDFEEEILFFITPRIVEGSFDDDSMKASL